MMQKLVLLFLILTSPLIADHDVLQRLLVLTLSWESQEGHMHLFERSDTHSVWKKVQEDISVSLGRNGLVWSKDKKEGDGKSPAGVFQLGAVFGRNLHLWDLKMPAFELYEDTEAVDDPRSRYYNTIVRRSTIPLPDWQSSEKMWHEPLYALGIVVHHNFPNVASGNGSAIFIHIRNPDAPETSGCTALARTDLERLVRWLDPAKQPQLIQLPKHVYRTKLVEWN